jgi:AraC-like DNA-binding protein
MTTGTLSARTVLRVVEFCRARGHDAEALCRSAGVALSALAEPDARVPYALAERLGERALALTGDESFGLHLARDVGDSRHYDAGVLLLMASPTIRAALERMVALQRYWGDGERATLHPAPGGRCVRYVLAGATGAYARHSYECALAEIALGVRALSGQELNPRVVRFAHGAPSVTVEHDDVFRCPVEFRAAHAEIEFGDEALDSRMLHANEAFCGIFEQQVRRAMERLPSPGSTSERVREVARAALSGGSCTLGDTAEALGVSVRTLQRRLRDEGTSFAEVVDALRRETAVAYLERRIPIPEVAALLGYSDATAFHHAFSRWTGSSPHRYVAPSTED